MTRISEFKPNRLISIDDVDIEDITLLYETTINFLMGPKSYTSLKGITIANLFFEDSTRTRLSFELAQKRLSIESINVTSSSSSIKKGESLLDTIQNILKMKVDFVVVRDKRSGVPKFLSDQTGIPVINAGDGTNEHPTQALLDLFTLWNSGLKSNEMVVKICGDIKHSRVAGSSIKLWNKLGIRYSTTGPNTTRKHIPNIYLDSTKSRTDIHYTLRIQKERQDKELIPSLDEYNHFFGLKKIQPAKNPLIMHPGPINRNVEIDSKLADSDRSLILNQVEMGVALRMAIIYLISKKKEAPAS